MSVSKSFHADVMETLGAHRPLRSRAMFGGYAIYADELVFALLDDDRIWFRFDELTAEDYTSVGAVQWAPPGAPPMGYYELPDAVLKDDKQLPVWMDKAIGAAERRKAKQKPRKPKAKK